MEKSASDDSDHESEQCQEEEKSMTLQEREARWGFSLDELNTSVKVVKTLFQNPSLFINDPYLEESRLYTMITRDRAKKRQFADVYKTIMKQEKSRKKRYLRREDEEAIRNTRMKREREQALNALLLTSPNEEWSPRLLLCENKTQGQQSPSVDEKEQEVGLTGGDNEEPVNQLSDWDKKVLRLVGAFECLTRLNRVYSGEELKVDKRYIRSHLPATTEGADRPPPECQQSNNFRNADFASRIDYTVVTSLIAQCYRYISHPYGTTMPSPIFPNPSAAETMKQSTVHGTSNKYERTIDAVLLDLAKEVEKATCHLNASNVFASKIDHSKNDISLRELLKLENDIIVRKVFSRWAHEETLRSDLRYVSDNISSPTSFLESERVSLSCVDISSGLLREVEVVLLEGGTSSKFSEAINSHSFDNDNNLEIPAPASLVARQALILFIARRLYHLQVVIDSGVSPLDLDYSAPISSSEEPEDFCPFDEVQLYADDHHESISLILSKFRACNICRVRYNHLHPYYYSLCHLCGEYNYNKRLMGRDLRGKVILLTGCRIKIGYAMAISLLRCGATVLGTTRFAHEAVSRFQQEPDYGVWRERLHLFSLDLRDLWVVTQFCAFVHKKFPKLFAIINNAAQTIQRTAEYTEKLRAIEMHPEPALRHTIQEDPESSEWYGFFLHRTSVTVGKPLSIEGTAHQQPFLPVDNVIDEEIDDGENDSDLPSTTAKKAADEVATLARANVAPTVYDRYDTGAEESDTRVANSWVMNLAEVDGSEAAEVMTINALAPFILNSKLKPCLENREGDAVENEPRFIINVSAMEGMFYRYKQTTHPHTNMAKAALNMMTRTSAADYAQVGIFMNSVDTGWITDESPKEKKERRAEQQMLCPLDEVDAAARCLDLIYTSSVVFGKFYKDFKEICW